MADQEQIVASIFEVKLRRETIALVLMVMFAATILATPLAQAQTYSVLHTFTGGNDGGHPGRLTMDAAGNLYGSSLLGGQQGGNCDFGGSNGCGAVFQLKHAGSGWIFNTLYMFQGGTDGARPGPVVFGPDGALYGTTEGGGSCQRYQYGCGTIFRLAPPATFCRTTLCSWVKTTLYSFSGDNDGWNYVGDAIGPLTFGPDGSMYGVTWYGGTHDQGVVFKLTPSNGGWTESILHTFAPDGQDGYNPSNGVILDRAGNLYGVTNTGGTGYAGTVYELSPSAYGWTESILYEFPGFGIYTPVGGLIFDPSGNLYGTTTISPGEYGGGAVFKLTPSDGSWTESVLYVFSGFPGGGPKASLTMDASGALYGTTWGDFPEGTVFKLTPSNGGWTETDLYGFHDGADGGLPISTVLFDAKGNLYGTAGNYGSYNWGVVWEITP